MQDLGSRKIQYNDSAQRGIDAGGPTKQTFGAAFEQAINETIAIDKTIPTYQMEKVLVGTKMPTGGERRVCIQQGDDDRLKVRIIDAHKVFKDYDQQSEQWNKDIETLVLDKIKGNSSLSDQDFAKHLATEFGHIPKLFSISNDTKSLAPPDLKRTSSTESYRKFGNFLAAAMRTEAVFGSRFNLAFFSVITKLCDSIQKQSPDVFQQSPRKTFQDLSLVDTQKLIDDLCDQNPKQVIELLETLQTDDSGQKKDPRAETETEKIQELIKIATFRYHLLSSGPEADENSQLLFELLSKIGWVVDSPDDPADPDGQEKSIKKSLEMLMIESPDAALSELKELATSKLKSYAAMAVGLLQSPKTGELIKELQPKAFQRTVCGSPDIKQNMIDALQLRIDDIKAGTNERDRASLDFRRYDVVKRFIEDENTTEETLERFCHYWTGQKYICPGSKLNVFTHQATTINASTCFNDLKIPESWINNPMVSNENFLAELIKCMEWAGGTFFDPQVLNNN